LSVFSVPNADEKMQFVLSYPTSAVHFQGQYQLLLQPEGTQAQGCKESADQEAAGRHKNTVHSGIFLRTEPEDRNKSDSWKQLMSPHHRGALLPRQHFCPASGSSVLVGCVLII